MKGRKEREKRWALLENGIPIRCIVAVLTTIASVDTHALANREEVHRGEFFFLLLTIQKNSFSFRGAGGFGGGRNCNNAAKSARLNVEKSIKLSSFLPLGRNRKLGAS